jgi:enamine deaminase RidA (YjgF/YER057c/UK114 family)
MKAVLLFLAGFILTALSACQTTPQTCYAEFERLDPAGAIQPTAQWGLGTRAGPYVFVSGMRGIDPDTNEIVLDLKERVRQAYTNMFFIAAAAGAQPDDLIETAVFIRTDAPHPSPEFFAIRRLDNDVRQEVYGDGPYPNPTAPTPTGPRTSSRSKVRSSCPAVQVDPRSTESRTP